MANYQSNRNKNNSVEEPGQTQSFASAKQEEKAQEQEASKKVAKTAAKGAAMYFAGPEGAQAVDLASKTKAGDMILNKGGEAISKNPALAKTAKKLDDSGMLDKADQGLSLAGSLVAGGTGGANAAQGTNMPNAAQASSGATDAGGSTSNVGGDSSFFGDGGSDSLNPFGKRKEKMGDENNDKATVDANDSVVEGKIEIPMSVKIFLIGLMPFFLLILFILIILAAIGGVTSDFKDAVGISQELNLPSGDYSVNDMTPEAKAYFQRVKEVQEEFAKQNKDVDALRLVAVYHVANYHDKFFGYDFMSKGRIREIANCMFDKDSTVYSEDVFKKNLTNALFKTYFPKADDSTRERYTNEVFDYISKYYQMIGYNPTSACAALGTCSYDIKGFYIYRKGNITKNINYTNLKVRLMQSGTANGHNYGGTFGLPLDGEELVDFEKYILGVAYAEIGSGAPEEAIKAQMVAARSYILARSTDMGGWRTIRQEGNNWVIQAANSTQDQVYCDPDKGCSSNDGQWGMIHSGLNHASGYKKPPLAANSRLRTLANETAGQVLVNSQGYVIYSGYLSTEQNQMSALANKGYNYKQILLEVYNSSNRPYGASDIQSMSCNNTAENCTNGVTGDFASWKQYQGPWVSVPMGTSGKTIKQIGCLATSVCMQIARSGVPTNIQGELNPGTFVQYLNSHGGFVAGGNFVWGSVSSVAPNFRYVGKSSVSGYSKDAKLSTLANLINQGYYVVAEVKGNTGQHWVAVVSINNGQILMMDPGSSSTDMWSQYNWANTSTFAYFRAG